MDREQIRQLRDSLGLTQEEFSHRLSVSVRTVARWEAGKGKPTRLALRALARLAKSSRRPAK